MSRPVVRPTAFSLVEVLVVIGIIAMLFAVLLPSIQRAKSQAARVGCQSNLRQIALATAGYAIDNHDYLPSPNWAGMDGYYPYPGWLYKPGTPFTATAMQTGAIWPWLRTPAVYKCQSDVGPFFDGTTHVMTSYIMNGAVCGFGLPAHLPSYKVHTLRPDAIIYWEGDPKLGKEWNDGSNYPPEGLAARHGNGAAVAAIDGHVDWMTVPAYSLVLNKSPGPLWCNPATPDGH